MRYVGSGGKPKLRHYKSGSGARDLRLSIQKIAGGASGAVTILPAARKGVIRVTDGTRTRDVQDHNLALYQLSYGHRFGDVLFSAAHRHMSTRSWLRASVTGSEGTQSYRAFMEDRRSLPILFLTLPGA